MSANIRAGLEVGLKALNLPTFLSQYALMAQQALEHKTTCEQYLIIFKKMYFLFFLGFVLHK